MDCAALLVYYGAVLVRQEGKALFHLQKYCYAFFLVHGAVLLLLSYSAGLSGGWLLLSGFLLSSVAAVALYWIATPVQRLLIQKTVRLLEPRLKGS